MNYLKPWFVVIALMMALTSPLAAQVNITTWQADLLHSGNNPNETTLTPANVGAAGEFGLLFTQQTDGQTYGQVLYASNVNVNGTTHNIVYVGTEHCSLYAFDADSNTGANANPIWHDAMIPANAEPVPQSVVGSGDISVELGMTTTPVIDLSSSTIYCVTKVETTAARTDSTGTYAAGTYQQYLHALDLATGAEKFGGPVLINPTFAGSATDGSGGVVPFSALHEHTRAAMTEYNGIVYISYASHSDTQPYHGEILGYNASTLQLTRTFISTPNGSEAGIWASGAGPAFDGNGNMFVALANGSFDQNASSYTKGTDWGESIVKLSATTPATGAFTANFSDPTTFFTPNNWNALNNGDLDLGSSGLCLLPTQTGGTHPHVMVGGGKGAVLYVVDRDSLGGINTTKDPAIQEIAEPNGDWLFVTPSYYNGYIYYAPSGGPLEQRAVGYNATTGGYIADPPTYQSTANFGGKGAGCFISSNGTTNGIAWILDGNLQAYNAANVSQAPIFTENATVPPNTGCQTTKFSLPMVANGKVYYTAFDNTNMGHLFVSGLIPPPVGSPAAPTNLAATATSLSSISLTWTNNATNESGFIIQRSSSANGTFTQVGTTSAGVTTFTDTNLSPATTYFYQVVATNANGNSFATNKASATTFPTYAPAGLVAYWNLDDGPVQTVTDVTGNGHNGAVNGELVYVSNGYINGCFLFHGTGFATSNIAVPNSAALQFAANQSFSVTAWVNPQNIDGVEQAIIAKSADQGNEYGIWINANNQWVGRGSGGDLVGPTAVQGAWTHVALVQDGVAGTRSLYVNGALVATGPAQAADGAGALWMGQQNQLLTKPDSFPGYIDEVHIYNRALSATDIAGLLSPPMLEATSLQAQGTSGTFGLVLAPVTTRVIEPREGSTPGTYTIVASFSAAVSGVTATLQEQTGTLTPVGTVQSVTTDSSGQHVTINLTGVGNDQALNIHLSGIQPGNGSTDIPFNVLWGDVNQNGSVNPDDVAIVTNNQANSVTSSTALYDLDCDGKIAASDEAIVNAQVGTSLGTEQVTNLALFANISATSVDAGSGNLASYAVDGNTGTRWESAYTDPQSYTIDLGQVSTINSVVIDWQDACASTYNINVSNDGVNWTTVVAVGTNAPGAVITTGSLTAVNPSQTVTYGPLNVTGRYVQMQGLTRATQYGYSIYEFQVNGTPGVSSGSSGPVPVITSTPSTSGQQGVPFSYQITATNNPTSYAATGLPLGLYLNTSTGVIYGSPLSSGSSTVALTATNANGTSATVNLALSFTANSDVNLALTGTATSSSPSTDLSPASLANDNNFNSRWETVHGTAADPSTLMIDLKQVDTIHRVAIDWEDASAADYTIDTSVDGTVWTNQVVVTNNPAVAPSILLTYGPMGVQARYVRMVGTQRSTVYGYSIYEFQVWGAPGTGSTPSFATQPASQTASAGQTVTFTASPSGTGPFTYQWQYDGTNIPGATGSTYTVSNVTSANYGNYLVVVTNANGSITSNYFSLSAPSATPPVPATDTPTLPMWGLMLLAALLVLAGHRHLQRERAD
jgi:hypothetical protein